MSKRPLIGITANDRLNTALDNISWTYAPTAFVKAVQQAGGIPILIPIGDETMAKTYAELVDKVIIIGGQNVDPKFYGEEKMAQEDDFLLERDLYEIALIKACLAQNKPLFTVCRGMQLTNVVLGGSLYQHIDNHWQEADPDVLTHTITITPQSCLGQIYGSQTQINSYHRQAIKTLADGLEVIARHPEDNTIEAVTFTDKSKRFLGVQWHPELLWQKRDSDQALFDYVVNQL